MTGSSSQIIDKPAGWYAEYLDTLPVGIFRTTLEGKLVFCNRAFARIFGFDSISDLIDYPVVNLYWEKKDRGDLIKAIMKSRYVKEACIAFKKRKGTLMWCAVTVKAVFDDDGIVVFLDGVIRDITEEIKEKKAAVRLDERERLTKDKFQGVLEMAGGVAHRLNQPLTVINNLLNEILSDLDPDDHNYQKIEKVHIQVKELNEIAKKIRAIKKYESMDYVGGIKIVDIDKAS